MAEILFKRILHPVGQGAFFTEQLFEVESRNLLFTIVYDCGSKSTGIRKIMENEIDNLFSNNMKINVLFLSHFDDDHINYVKYLHSKHYLDDSKVIVPLIFEEKFICISYLYYNYTQLMNELLSDEKIHVVQVGFDDGMEDPKEPKQYYFDEIGNEQRIIESGSKLTFKDYPIWYWVPFNFKHNELIDEFRGKLGKANIDINKIVANATFNEDKTVDLYVLDNINELKAIYKSLSKNRGDGYGTSINLNSLQLLSFPASLEMCMEYNRNTTCNSYISDYMYCNRIYLTEKCEKEQLYIGSCLYTGDTSSNSDKIWEVMKSKINNYLGRKLALFQIPHHGSKNSNDDRIAQDEKIYGAFTNFDPDYFQKIFDPNICLQFELKQKPLVLVTKENTSRFEEYVIVNKK